MALHTIPGTDGEVPAIEGVLKRLDKETVPHNQPQTNGVVHSHGDKASPGPQLNGTVSERPNYVIPMVDQLAFTPRKLKIITIGAGFSGLMVAQKFQHRYPEMQNFIEHKIFEGRSEVGGTWLVNTYPGVQCDVPSHLYVCDTLESSLLEKLTRMIPGLSL